MERAEWNQKSDYVRSISTETQLRTRVRLPPPPPVSCKSYKDSADFTQIPRIFFVWEYADTRWFNWFPRIIVIDPQPLQINSTAALALCMLWSPRLIRPVGAECRQEQYPTLHPLATTNRFLFFIPKISIICYTVNRVFASRQFI